MNVRPRPGDMPAAAAQSFRIRQARRGDAEPITTLLRELHAEIRTDLSTVNWVMSHPEMEIFVAADNLDKVIGFLSLSHRPQLRLSGRIATLDELVVLPNWRKKGVGKALMTKALERVKILAVKRFEVVATKERSEGLAPFLNRCGFNEAPSLVFRYQVLEKT